MAAVSVKRSIALINSTIQNIFIQNITTNEPGMKTDYEKTKDVNDYCKSQR